jgi:hypothetical protein
VGSPQRFEQRLESMVYGAFARVFRSAVQPVEIAAALEGAPAAPELAVFVARDGVQRFHVDRQGYTAANAIRQVEPEGGQDDLTALVQGWEWAAAVPGGRSPGPSFSKEP